MATEKIEVLVGKKGTGEAPAGKSALSSPTRPSDTSEVGGRVHYWRQMVCWRCSGVSWIWYDTDAYHTYICTFCSAANVV